MCEYITEIFIAIGSGLIASILAVIIINKLEKHKLKKDLKKYLGKWTTHPLDNRTEPDESRLQGEVTITYDKNNILNFYHKNKIPNREGIDWQGKLIINKEYLDTGRLIWQYIETSKYSDLGYKEIILKEKADYYLLYLIGINFGDQQYGFEVCKRMK